MCGAGSLGNNIIKYQESAKENRRNSSAVFSLPCVDVRILLTCLVVATGPGATLSPHCGGPAQDASGETKPVLDLSSRLDPSYIISLSP